MKVKKYVAPTMPEAMSKIRKELGSNAVILNSKEVQEGGLFGLFKKRKIEVIAALDESPIIPKKPKKSNGLENIKPLMKETDHTKDSDILNEIKHLKKLVQQQSIHNDTKFESDYQIIYQHLIDQEIMPHIAERFVKQVQQNNQPLKKDPSLRELVTDVQTLMEKDLANITYEGISYSTKVVHFIGPTGVGKTTTLAKVAANSILNDKKSVAFITMDTYRIAAIEQLKTYAKILDVPVEVAYSLEDYNQAIAKLSNYDLILVDTAGRNYRDKKYVNELKSSINETIPVETFLVLSLTAKPKDIIDIYDSFHLIPIKEVIFTKLDETRQYGSILNLSLEKEIGLAYLTNGQDVPDDILNPSPTVISNLIVGESFDA